MRVWCQMVFKKIIIKKWVKPPKVYPNFCLVLFLLVVLYVWLGSAIWGCFFISYSTPPPTPPPLQPQPSYHNKNIRHDQHIDVILEEELRLRGMSPCDYTYTDWLNLEVANLWTVPPPRKKAAKLKDIGRKPNQLRRWLAVLRRTDRSRWNSSLHAVTQSIVFCFFFLSESGTSRHDRDVAGTLTLW